MKKQVMVLIACLALLGCGKGSGGGSGGGSSSRAGNGVQFAQQTTVDTTATYVQIAAARSPLERFMDGLIPRAFASTLARLPNLTFSPADQAASVNGFTGCNAIDNADGISLLPFTYGNGGTIGFVPEIAQGDKILIVARAFLDGTNPALSQTVTNNGGTARIDVNKPVAADGSSGCSYWGVAITSNWNYTLDAGCTTATLSTTNQADGAVVLHATGSGETCTLTAAGVARNGLVMKSVNFKTTASSNAAIVDNIEFDTHELPLNEQVRINFTNPDYAVTNFGMEAMRFQLNGNDIQENGTVWMTSNAQSGVGKVYDWVKDTRQTTVLVTARKTGTNILSQRKFYLSPQ